MGDVTPFKRPQPVSNLKPITGALRDAVGAMVQAINALDEPSVFGAMSSPRRAILECLVKAWPQQPGLAELRLASGLSKAALAEHLQALRWKGWLMFESLAFAPLTEKRLIELHILQPDLCPVEPAAETSAPATAPAGVEEPITTPPLTTPSAPTPPARQAARRVARPHEEGRKVPEPAVRSNPAGSGTKPSIRPALCRDWMTERRERLQRAISFLKSKAILVTLVDRDALVPTYRVSGKQAAK